MIRPVGERIVLKRKKAEETVKGIIFPESAKKKPDEFEVISVGETDQVAVGDIVLLARYAGQEITLDDQVYLIAKVEDVIGILDHQL